ncbi:sequence-specific DNA binding transcription factor ATNDX isoform X2 [Carex rostrata]
MDIVSAVEEFNGYNSKDLSKVLKDSENSTLNWKAKDGSVNQIDIEKLAAALPLNLTAVLLSPNDGDRDFAYVLRGVRLLNTLSDVAIRHARLEQILLDDVKVLEQVMDLVFFTMIVLSHRYQGGNLDSAPIIRTTLGACVLHLLSSSLTSQWNELAVVLLAHPKVERFVESAFGSLHENTRLFRQKLTELSSEIVADQSKLPDAMKVSHFLSQQCEASLQFLLSLCQQKLFRDRVLKNKELCKNGGILSLARTILRLRVPECFQHSSEIIASVSRFKAKILALLLLLCEAETISYLDEVAGSPKSMQLGQSVALEFLNMLKTAFRREESKHANAYKKNTNMNIPRGFLLINSLRLVDIFSDDSNFRFSFMTTTVPFMSEILATPHEDFVSSWCSVNLPTIEEEANLEYDVFNAVSFAATAMAGGAISEANFACQLSLSSMHAVTYAQLRTSCIVKIIANLHIFVPNICEEHERDLFVREFHNHLVQERPMSSAAEVCKNLSSLAEYVKTLIPSLINQDDVQLLRVFTDTLRGYCNLQGGESTTEQAGSGELAKVPKAENMYHTEQSLMNLAAAFNSKGMDIDPKPEPEKLDIDKATVTRENTKESDPNEDERIEASNPNSQDQRKKRKRNIMNDVQIKLIERALLDEPEMQRNAAALQTWADTLSNKGSEITPSQLKNWLNNRKARLARVAKETRHTSEGENPDSPNEEQPNMPSNSKTRSQ